MSRVKGGGSSANCCCGGCGSPPFSADVPVGSSGNNPGVQPLQRFCVACAPNLLCVAVKNGDQIYGALWGRIDPGCVPGYIEGQTYWAGFLPTGGEIVAGRLDFVVDEYDQCWLQLTSDSGGLLASDGRTMLRLTTDVRDELDPGCLPCDYRPGGNMVWDVIISGKSVTVTITVPCSVSLNNGSDCSGQPASCTPPSYEDIPQSIGCGLHCSNCGCICGDAIVTITVNGRAFSVTPLQMCNYIYSAIPPNDPSTGPILSVEADPYTSACYLVLRSLGAPEGYPLDITNELPAPIQLGIGSLRCPRPYASWTLSTGDIPAKSVRVVFECAECGGPAGEIVTVPCCPDPLPRSMTLELDCSACGCSDVSITVVNNSPEGIFQWSGCSEPDALHCYPPPLFDVCVSVGCGDYNHWTLGVKFTGDSQYTLYTNTGGSCSPMNLVWNNIVPQGIGVCRPPAPAPYPTLTARLLE